MLTTRSNNADLLARLAATPGAVQASTSTALAAYVRARSSGVSKGEALRAHLQRTRAERLQPDRAGALGHLQKPGSLLRDAPAGLLRMTKDRDRIDGRHAEERSTERVSKHAAPIDAAMLQQIAVQAALKALGRGS